MNTSAREGGAGEYTDLHLHRGKLFQRHMTRAIHILELRDEAREARSSCEKAIEQLPHGVILLDDTRRISFRNGATDPIWQINVSRVAPGDDRAARGRRWMLTLKLHPDGDQIQADYLIKRFGLTRSEAAVCKCLCHYGDAVSTAKALGLSPNTVRTHLKSAFRKTGTRNQVELAICSSHRVLHYPMILKEIVSASKRDIHFPL